MGAVEQLQTQGAFQGLDAAGQRRGREVQALGRLQERMLLRDDDQVFQAFEVQHKKYSITSYYFAIVFNTASP
jgi:hypothetical protein